MEQQSLRDAGDDEAQMLDIDYVETRVRYAAGPAVSASASASLVARRRHRPRRRAIPASPRGGRG